MKNTISGLLLLLISTLVIGQSSDTLMTIDGHVVDSEEFLRIYNKNSNIAEENQKSIDEYLDLFINYKLKVVEAENMGYDTAQAFVTEMAGYTRQLAKPYLENNEALDSFVLQAYERQQEEINASHILLRLSPNALPADTARVYNRLIAMREQILAGKDFYQVIEDESPSEADKIGGDLGWFTAFRMVYPFETAAYNTPVGEISMPVRTNFGYHLVKVNDRRPTRPEVFASHIMTIIPRNNPTEIDKSAAKEKIEKAYAALEAGQEWDEVVKEYSEHRSTIAKGGDLGYLRTGNAPDEILDTLYTLDTMEYSAPFLTQYGYHIVRPKRFKELPTFAEVEDDLRSKIRSMGEIKDITQDQILERIKKEYGFEFNEENLTEVMSAVDSSIYNGRWRADQVQDMQKEVFSIGDSSYSQYDVAKIWEERRVTVPEKEPVLRGRAMDFMEMAVIEYERARLPQKYPEYKHLLEEYHDGILLFNLTEDMVWKKAIEDTTGLEAFYAALPEKYMWDERVAITKYSYSDSSLTEPLISLAKKRAKKGQSAEDLSAVLCPQDTIPCISFIELKYEEGDNAVADSLTWKRGSYLTSKDKNNFILYVVDGVLKPQEKTLKDARGLYTADYQSKLEKEWVAELRKKYTVDINESELEKLKQEQNQTSSAD